MVHIAIVFVPVCVLVCLPLTSVYVCVCVCLRAGSGQEAMACKATATATPTHINVVQHQAEWQQQATARGNGNCKVVNDPATPSSAADSNTSHNDQTRTCTLDSDTSSVTALHQRQHCTSERHTSALLWKPTFVAIFLLTSGFVASAHAGRPAFPKLWSPQDLIRERCVRGVVRWEATPARILPRSA
jgi:hypothetical protein